MNFLKKLISKNVERPRPSNFESSSKYWEDRYSMGGNSGGGSYNHLAEFKAEILNDFVLKNEIKKVIEFGSGDGNQLALAKYPNYLGLDVSPTVIEKCKKRYSQDTTKKFQLVSDYSGEKADLSLSLDVIFHLVEDEVFHAYMESLFNASSQFVIVFASNTDDNSKNHSKHVRHRKFTNWVQTHRPEWKLIDHIPNKYPYNGDNINSSFADFYIFNK